MIKLLPEKLSALTPSNGEISIYNKIRKFHQEYDWSVMHSYNVPNHIFKKWSEIDFLIIVPNKGIVCLEVKDHKEIRLQDRQWLFGAKREKKESPFKQIKDNQESLLKEIKKIDINLNVPWWSAVVFTSARFADGSLPPEIMSWEFMDADAYASSEFAFFNFIENVIEQGRKVLNKNKNSDWITSNDNKPEVYRKLVETLSGQGTFSISKKARNGDREISLSLATDEQFQVLDLLSQTKRLLVEGLAGTGKTLMAAKIAEREALKGQVLFLAYNTNLISELKHWPSLQSKNITLQGIDKFFKDEVKSNLHINSENYWDEVLPMQFIDQLAFNKLSKVYDYLVVDEAQDIFSKPYKVSALNKILKGGFSEGNWSLFGDFNEQMIFGNQNRDEILGNLHEFSSSKRYINWTLRKNVRNPKDIGFYAQDYGRIGEKYDSFLRLERGSWNYTIYNKENRLTKLKEIIDQLLLEGYEQNQIIVLTKLRLDRIIVDYLKNQGLIIKDVKSDNLNNEFIRHATIGSFKGLESPVVVLMDLEEFDSDIESLFYIAITRATEKLVIHTTAKAITEINDV